MDNYRHRIADRLLSESLEALGGVLVQGTKWCGKTTTSVHHAGSVLYMDDPETKEQNMVKRPSFLMVLTGIGQFAYTRPDGVFVIPIGCLKD